MSNQLKVVIQASGGVESTTLIHYAMELGHDVSLIAFDTGSVFWLHRDSVAIKRVVNAVQLQNRLFICKMPQVDQLEYTKDSQYADVGFIPGYKLLMNVASMAYAQKVNAHEVWCGNMGDNVYPDESPEFIKSTTELYQRTYGGGIQFVSPFQQFTKGEVIERAVELGVDLSMTVSCGDERLFGGFNCGVCPWCKKRRAGFDAANILDPTYYYALPDTHHNYMSGF